MSAGFWHRITSLGLSTAYAVGPVEARTAGETACPTKASNPRHDKGVIESSELTALQWQILMKCWKMSVNGALRSWWGPPAWCRGEFLLWLWKLRKTNGPAFTWPLLMFTSMLPERLMEKMGKIYRGRALAVKSQ